MDTQQLNKILKPDVFNKVSNLEVRARKIVEGYLNGIHRSPYLGNSVEFASHREYVPGDNIKNLDWKVWARSDKLFIKQYENETNLACNIILDVSKSMDYGLESDGINKLETACTIAATFAYLMRRQADAVGLTAFDRKIRVNLKPSSHPSHMKLIFHELAGLQPDDKTEIHTPLHQLAELIHKKGLVVLISDLFVNIESLNSTLKHFKYFGQDVIVFQVLHSDEIEFPFKDNILFKGMETSVEIQADALSLKKEYIKVVQETNQKIKKTCSKHDCDHVLVSTSDSLATVLSSYLNFRQKLRSKR
ncbi:MAG: DUF58 domain-containing protein [Planctomycetota bacterium]|nr:MAG: DUF58 domain-containing protein [Planctomycetota bacterium]